MKKEKLFLLLISAFVLTMIGMGGARVNAAASEMTIYGIYANTGSKGDAVLVESKGKYLLMDIGTYSHSDAIIAQLKSLNVKKTSLYFSHLHIDHVGGARGNWLGGIKKLINAGITIETLYLPAKELTPESLNYPTKYQKIEKYMKTRTKIVYLKVGNTFQIGDVKAKIIGPIATSAIHPDNYAHMGPDDDDDDNDNDKYTYYENNSSLAAMLTCDKTKFFTAGDALKDEADILVKTYGNALKADIMKLNHHGTGSGNTAALINAVSPKYAFACNTGLADINPMTQKWKTYGARGRVIGYGMCYLIGNQKKTVVYQVKNNNIKVYTGSILNNTLLSGGWVSLVGSDGQFRKTDMYYFDDNGIPLKGIQKIDDKYYNLGEGGCMEYGNYSSTGEYQGWKTYNGKRRYYTLSKSKKYAYMAMGFQEVNGILYYFDKNGFRITGNGQTEIKKIGKYYYCVRDYGGIVRYNWEKLNGNTYFLDKNGRMLINKKFKFGNMYYYFGSDGKMACAESGVKLVKASGTARYGARKNGTLIISNWATIKGNKYYFGKSGKMVTSKRVKMSGRYYYFGKSGKMVRDKRIKIGKSSYYFAKNGRMITNKRVEISGNYYYFGTKGKMVTNKLVKISRKYYYFGKKGKMVMDKLVKIGHEKYYFGKDGSMYKDKFVYINGKEYYCQEDGKVILSDAI